MPARWTLVALAGFVLAGCAVHVNQPKQPVPAPAGHSFTVYRDVTYTPPDWPEALQADVYVPSGKGPFPGVLVVHGGGWQAGSRNNMGRVARMLARMGMVAVNISYRLAPEYRFPAQLYDLQQAVRWMRVNHEKYQIDPRHIGALGYSAGGHLVALLGTVIPGGPLDSPYGGRRTRVEAVAAGGAPTDLRKLHLPQYLPDFLGGTKAEIPQRYALASPILHVRKTTPPFFLFHGQLDRLVPFSQAKAFAANLKHFGVHVELYRMPLRNHVLSAISTDAWKAAARFLYRMLR